MRTGLTEPAGSPQLAMGTLGAIALWVEGNVIVASGTDHGLPRVEALAKPKKVGIGVLGPFSVRASDTWSPIVDVTWRYGDGTSEHGASVRHAYTRAGAFHVTAIVSDAAGNAAQRTFVVTTSPIARALSATATPRGLSVGVACLPSSPRVTGTVTANCHGARTARRHRLPAVQPERQGHLTPIAGAKAVPFRCTVAGRGTRARAGKVKRGRRVAVRVIGLDLAGLPHISALTLPAR